MSNHRITYRFDRNGHKIEQGSVEYSVSETIDTPKAVVHKVEEVQAINEVEEANELNIDSLEKLIRGESERLTDEKKQEGTPISPYVMDEDKYMDSTPVYSIYGENQIELLPYDEPEEAQKKYELDIEEEADRISESQKPTAKPQFNDHYYTTHADLSRQFTEEASSVSSNSWLQSAGAILGAVVSGVLIGYLMLTLVFGISIWPFSTIASNQSLAEELQSITIAGKANTTSTASSATNAASESSSATNTAGTASAIDQETLPTIALSKEHFDYYILQAGVFTQQKTLDELINQLQASGYPAHSLVSDNKHYVYTGIATSKATIEPLQQHVKGIETYGKQLTIEIPDQFSFNGDHTTLEQFIKQTNEMIGLYANLVSIQFEQTSFSKIGQAAFTSAQQQYEQYASLADETISLFASDEDAVFAAALKDELVKINKSMVEYQQKPLSKHLWDVQSALTKAVLLQKEWFDAI